MLRRLIVAAVISTGMVVAPAVVLAQLTPPADIPGRPPGPGAMPQQIQPLPTQPLPQVPVQPRPLSIERQPLAPPPSAGPGIVQPRPPAPGVQPITPNAALPQPAVPAAPRPQAPRQQQIQTPTPPSPAAGVPPGTEDFVVVAPPAQRIENRTAVFNGLDKVTGRIIAFDAAIGETVQFGALQVTPRACYTRPPSETPNTTGFSEVDEITLKGEVKRLFTGWMFAASPGLHGVEHPIYDIWLVDCKQTAPDTEARRR